MGTTTNLPMTREEMSRLFQLPEALQKTYILYRYKSYPLDTSMTFSLLDMVELLHEFEQMRDKIKRMEEGETLLLQHRGGVNMVPYDKEYHTSGE